MVDGSTDIVAPLGMIAVVAAESLRVVPEVPVAAVVPAGMPDPLTPLPTAMAGVPTVSVIVVLAEAVAEAVVRMNGPCPLTFPANGPWAVPTPETGTGVSATSYVKGTTLFKVWALLLC